MTMQSHLAELERRHDALETAIEKELVLPSSDDLKLCEMKKRKLRLKDEIERLRHPHEADTAARGRPLTRSSRPKRSTFQASSTVPVSVPRGCQRRMLACRHLTTGRDNPRRNGWERSS